MDKKKYDVIIRSLSGHTISDYFDGWSFQMNEIAPYVFRVDGYDAHGHTATGFGTSAENALDDFVKRATRVIRIQKFLSRLGLR